MSDHATVVRLVAWQERKGDRLSIVQSIPVFRHTTALYTERTDAKSLRTSHAATLLYILIA